MHAGGDARLLERINHLGTIYLEPVELEPDDIQVPGMNPIRLLAGRINSSTSASNSEYSPAHCARLRCISSARRNW